MQLLRAMTACDVIEETSGVLAMSSFIKFALQYFYNIGETSLLLVCIGIAASRSVRCEVRNDEEYLSRITRSGFLPSSPIPDTFASYCYCVCANPGVSIIISPIYWDRATINHNNDQMVVTSHSYSGCHSPEDVGTELYSVVVVEKSILAPAL